MKKILTGKSTLRKLTGYLFLILLPASLFSQIVEIEKQEEEETEKVADLYLTGDWGGVRQKMAEKGVVFETVYTAESVYNAMGGTSQGYAALGNLDITLDMDMAKLLGWTGGHIFVYGLGGHGQSPSGIIGDLQVTSNIDAGMDYFKLYHVWIQQTFLDDKIGLLLGLHDLNSEFYVTDPAGLFFNSSFGIGADLSQTGVNGPSIFPSNALAARLNVQPVENFYINAGLYNAIAGNPDDPGATYIDFTFAEGFLIAGEIGYASENDIKIAGGGWVYTKQISNLNGKNDTGYGAYLLFDKTLEEKFSFFVRGGIANPLVYQIALNISGGIHLSGKLWGRDDDEFGLGVTTVINSDDYRKSSATTLDIHETAFELTYRIQPSAWVAVQPDVQYVLNPGANPALADALLFSIRAQISF